MVLDDVNHYVRPQSATSQQTVTPTAAAGQSTASDEPFDRFADKKRILEFVQNACETCLTR